MNRDAFLNQVTTEKEPWDIIIIGGGATGVGAAVDAASRGYRTLLLEQCDFGKGTSSRSTKLVHGGVRYLQQGNVSLVMDALKERGRLLANAPHLVRDVEFIVPNYAWWEAPFYGIGMKIYSLLAGKYGFGTSGHLSREEVLERIPTLEQEGLRGGVKYHDGQFDDARLLINLAQTAAQYGACLLNYATVKDLLKDEEGIVTGVVFTDEESGARWPVEGRCVINATGPFCDALRHVDEPQSKPMIAPSQGIHLVLSRDFLPGDSAIMVPHTRDGRVMFAIPWHDHVIVGTTDTPIEEAVLEPMPQEEEIDFLLETASAYLARHPRREDVLSVFTGIRPLVKSGDAAKTAALSRDHTLHISNSGLITVTGGKWTTYRHMAEDTIDQAMVVGHLPERPCITHELRIHGATPNPVPGDLALYGSDASLIQELVERDPSLGELLHVALPISRAQVIWAVRQEMARTVEDVLARRTRALFLNAPAALVMAAEVAALMAQELGQGEEWQRAQLAGFQQVAQCYLLSPSSE